MTATGDGPVGRRLFTDGFTRPVYADGSRQYVIGPDGANVYGVWLVPDEDLADIPVIVKARDGKHHP